MLKSIIKTFHRDLVIVCFLALMPMLFRLNEDFCAIGERVSFSVKQDKYLVFKVF